MQTRLRAQVLSNLLVVWIASCFGLMTWAQEEVDLESLRPGVLVRLEDAQGRTLTRVEFHLRWHLSAPQVEPRLGPGPWKIYYQGILQVRQPGGYRFWVQGPRASFRFSGQEVELRPGPGPGWLQSKPVELGFGFYRFELCFVQSQGEPLGLFWQGPNWPPEPIPPGQLFHLHQDLASWFQEGALLAQVLRCGACHRGSERPSLRPAPALVHFRFSYRPQWAVKWLLSRPEPDSEPMASEEEASELPMALARGPGWWVFGWHPGRRMPHVPLSPQEARAVVAYLWARSQPLPPPPKPNASKVQTRQAPNSSRKKRKSSPPPSAQEGRRLFFTLGCMACHRLQGLGNSGPWSGGALDHVAQKRPQTFFQRWLLDPQSLNPDAQMPRFDLTRQERQSLVLFLATLRGSESQPDKKPFPSWLKNSKLIAQGKNLVQRWRCGACHRLPESVPSPALAPLGARSRWERACWGQARPETAQVGYHLPTAAQKRIRFYFSQPKPSSSQVHNSGTPGLERGWELLIVRGCVNCHARDRFTGLEEQLQSLVAEDPQLGQLLPVMKPPALFTVGDKLTDKALRQALEAGVRRRWWFAVRMPRFELSPEELQALLEHLKAKDRVPQELTRTHVPSEFEPGELLASGSRLVTAGGFGCTSCHQIGPVIPEQVELKSRGPDLSELGRRIRHSWYWRWMPNPARIVPRMEMPGIVSAVPGVLGGDLRRQLEAVWHVLNQPGFRPPRPDPVRVVRRHNDPNEPPQPAVVLTDVVEFDPQGKTACVKPLLVGLPNRHNVLLDLTTGQLGSWWVGDVAYQRTRGKTWYWEPGSVPLWPWPSSPNPAWQLRHGQRVWTPVPQGQYLTEFDFVQHTPGGIRLGYRLRLLPQGKSSSAAASDQKGVILQVEEWWNPAGPLGTENSDHGFLRRVEVSGVPSGSTLEFAPLPWPLRWSRESQSSRKGVLQGRGKSFQVEVFPAQAEGFSRMLWWSPGRGNWLAVVTPQHSSHPTCTLRWQVHYRSQFAADRYTRPEPPPALEKAQQFRGLVPGFVGYRLPLPREIMPTGLAWDSQGTLFLSSLKGRVWKVEDRNHDGLPEHAQVFSDELAAPYGLAVVRTGVVDVINKYALLRLYDQDGDGRAERMQTLASGWGHTRDYHDWAVGLPRDERGNYYIALACQQDQRSAAGARWRGCVLRLLPQENPTPASRLFRPELLARGFRFPMGIALDGKRRVWVTDNQGNFTPFNELNLVQPGRWYGFPNQIERVPGAKFPPVEEPTVNIPHPWTRSVNGLCVLATPQELRKRLGREVFGPFEGHLIGCEYNLQKLVRFTVEKVQGQWQGAVYPFSRPDHPLASQALLGPVVCGVSPQGELVVGNLRDSAWGGGNNQGHVVVFRPQDKWPLGIAQVRAWHRGFVIHFTGPVDPRHAGRRSAYQVASFRRIRTPAYGGPDVDRRQEVVRLVQVAPDRRSVRLELGKLREGFVYEFHLRPLGSAEQEFFPAEAYYTLRRIPPVSSQP